MDIKTRYKTGTSSDVTEHHNHFSKSDARFLRGIEVAKAFGQATKNDLLVHPWKLFFLVTPFAPPVTGMITVILTAMHISLGLTQHARTQRKVVTDSFKTPLSAEDYSDFLHHAEEEKAPGQLEETKPENTKQENAQDDASNSAPAPRRIMRKAIFWDTYYKSWFELYDMSRQYGEKMKSVWGAKTTLRYIFNRQVRALEKIQKNVQEAKKLRGDDMSPQIPDLPKDPSKITLKRGRECAL